MLLVANNDIYFSQILYNFFSCQFFCRGHKKIKKLYNYCTMLKDKYKIIPLILI